MVSSDPEDLVILSPAILVTHRDAEVQENLTDFDTRDMYREQWKLVENISVQNISGTNGGDSI